MNKCVYIDRAYEFNTIVKDNKNYAKVKPCCHSHWGLIPNGIRNPLESFETNEVITNNQVIQWFRDYNKTGALPKTCKACTQIESAGGKSSRQSSLEDYDPDYDIFMLDIHTGNECNLACSMCNSYSSSLIKKEMSKYNPQDLPSNWQEDIGQDQNSVATFAQLDQIMSSKSVQYIKFKGGEPMLKRNWVNIERGLLSGQYAKTRLRITTNGTNLNPNVLKTLSLAKSVSVNVSVDGFGAVGEMIRWPQTAGKIQQTLDNIANNKDKHIKFNTQTIVSIMNLGAIEDIWKRCSSVSNQTTFDFDLKPEGHPLDYRNVPIDIRAKVRSSMDPSIMYKKASGTYGTSTPLRNLIDIQHEGWTAPAEVKRTLAWFEKHRGQSLENVLHPEIYKWYLSI